MIQEGTDLHSIWKEIAIEKGVGEELDPLRLDHLPAFPLFCSHAVHSLLIRLQPSCLPTGRQRKGSNKRGSLSISNLQRMLRTEQSPVGDVVSVKGSPG